VKQPSFRAKTQPKSIFQKIFNIGPDVIIYDPRALEAVDALHLTQSHLQTLRRRFDDIDIDGSGSIDIDEFLESIGEQRSPFTDRIFKTIDIDGSGSIEFDEFIRILATYCMYTKDDILRFCFECFDKDGSNAIDENEFMQLCK
jgi:calcium-dependent protein kinase